MSVVESVLGHGVTLDAALEGPVEQHHEVSRGSRGRRNFKLFRHRGDDGMCWLDGGNNKLYGLMDGTLTLEAEPSGVVKASFTFQYRSYGWTTAHPGNPGADIAITFQRSNTRGHGGTLLRWNIGPLDLPCSAPDGMFQTEVDASLFDDILNWLPQLGNNVRFFKC